MIDLTKIRYVHAPNPDNKDESQTKGELTLTALATTNDREDYLTPEMRKHRVQVIIWGATYGDLLTPLNKLRDVVQRCVHPATPNGELAKELFGEIEKLLSFPTLKP